MIFWRSPTVGTAQRSYRRRGRSSRDGDDAIALNVDETCLVARNDHG